MIIKKIIYQPIGSTRPNPLWIGWDLCDGLGWDEFFLTHHGGLDQKIPLTRPMHTPIKNFYTTGLLVEHI